MNGRYAKETKHERFIRVAEKRTQNVLDALESLSQCAARESYDYTDSDVKQILSAIEQGLQNVHEKFAGVRNFSLSTPLPDEAPTFILCLAYSKEEFDNSEPSETYELNTLKDCIRECRWLRACKSDCGEPDYFGAYVVAEDGSNPWRQIFDPQYRDNPEYAAAKSSLNLQIEAAAAKSGSAHADTNSKECSRASDYFL